MKTIQCVHTTKFCKTCLKPKKYEGKGKHLVSLCNCWKKEKKK